MAKRTKKSDLKNATDRIYKGLLKRSLAPVPEPVADAAAQSLRIEGAPAARAIGCEVR
jgi:hypothetical protein